MTMRRRLVGSLGGLVIITDTLYCHHPVKTLRHDETDTHHQNSLAQDACKGREYIPSPKHPLRGYLSKHKKPITIFKEFGPDLTGSNNFE